ncbi:MULTISPECIES: cupin domain-containing protein [Cyanophyceae]|uniref:Cupin domain-containing protein n=1 Tax=Leptolyngbya subtilissima DQ-A4 TaxID=2933933 RepID=A0ABV0K5M2_9CYAN|nr:cupin domain-containing protein [Nodosilinea sp. FACHB-141]MBD2113228.1 cupin domain-containing protein [Nodosilinea sp. FACHB-141]
MPPVPESGNLFQLPDPLPAAELFTVLFETPRLRIERILSTGQTTPPDEWYDQSQDEWVVLLQGSATLTYEDGASLALGPGDYVLIPAHRRHRVDFTSSEPPCVWLAIHSFG